MAFRGTCAYAYPDWLFEGQEFCWGNSAYPISSTCVAVHKRPASLVRENRIFDQCVSSIRVRSEHCMAALKNRFQCLKGLNITINGPDDHIWALEWIKTCVILHNIIVDMEQDVVPNFEEGHNALMGQGEANNNGDAREDEENDDRAGEEKRQQLIQELLIFKGLV